MLTDDNYERTFIDKITSLKELNKIIDDAGNILSAVGGFEDIDKTDITTENFDGY